MTKPDDAELLAWLDGELSPERRAEIQAQLEADWEVRTTLAQMERRIGKYIEATTHQSPVEIEPFQDFWERLAPQLEPAAAVRKIMRPVPPTFFARLQQRLAAFPLAWRLTTVAGVVLLLATVWMVFLSLSPRVRPVSAQELLQRSVQGEELQVKQIAEPVVYRKLQVRRAGTNESVTWESWNDPQRKQFRQRVADPQGVRFLRANETTPPALLVELEAVWQANQLDAQRPLSAVTFAAWRAQVQRQSELVTSTQEGLQLTITTAAPHVQQAIIVASLTVRRSDWHAVALQLQVQGENEVRRYELSETAYEVLPLQALTVFADLPPVPLPTASRTPMPATIPIVAATGPTPTPSLPSMTALQDAEVAALYVLHQLRADLGEQLEVVREAPHQIVVRGLVQSAKRKEELVQALRRLALVRPQILTLDEAVQQAQNSASASAQTALAAHENTVTESQTIAPVNPFQQKLIEQFGGRKGLTDAEREEVNRQVTQFYNAVEADSSAAMAEARALQRLQERFALMSELDDASRLRLKEMQDNHRTRLQQRARNLQARLRPLLIAFVGEVSAPALLVEPTRQAQLRTVFRTIEQIGRLTDQLITGHNASSSLQMAQALMAELAHLEAVLTALEKN